MFLIKNDKSQYWTGSAWVYGITKAKRYYSVPVARKYAKIVSGQVYEVNFYKDIYHFTETLVNYSGLDQTSQSTLLSRIEKAHKEGNTHLAQNLEDKYTQLFG